MGEETHYEDTSSLHGYGSDPKRLLPLFMKTKESLSKSAEHCLKRALEETENVKRALLQLKDGAPLQKIMPLLRLQGHEIEKNIHEFNAYRNALDTV